MDNREIVKRFYEVVVSGDLLEELPWYISEACVLYDRGKSVPV